MRPRTSRPAFLVLPSVVLVITAACSARQAAPSVAGEPATSVSQSQVCDRSDQDSSSYAHRPLYRACAVDVKARPKVDGGQPLFTPPRGDGLCYFVAIEVAVDTSGLPEPGTARVVRTNDDMFASAVMSTVPGYVFTPARIGGTAVRQIFDLSMALMTFPARSATRTGPIGPMAGRRPPCATRR
jgi:hypothetical protein